MPEFREISKLCRKLQDERERLFPGLARPLYFDTVTTTKSHNSVAAHIEGRPEASTLDEANLYASLSGKLSRSM